MIERKRRKIQMKQIQNTTYYINEEGKVFNKKTNRWIKGSLDKNGYRRFRLFYPDGLQKNVSIHRMVLETFYPVENMNKLEVNHIDGNKDNNNISNLEWVTHEENMSHAKIHSLTNNCHRVGELNSKAKITEDDVRAIRADTRSYQEIADDYDVSKSTIGFIKTYRSWKHVK